ncbi:molecular chaperone [Pseudomonas sp. GCM10022186]|uniref:fimbrial biogenesis chaperone n=1 Tax=Pseudomonas sp. GCM10022186 TaxID=3252650 RepID=UPI00360A42D0
MAELSFNGENRFIMADARTTITLANEDKESALAQVTLDWGDGDEERDLPMALSTPLVRIPARQKATVDVLYEGHGLPEDRESYFLLSVLDVPKTPKDPNVLQIALRHRFKLFYRPALQMTPDAARAAMTWERLEGSEGQVRIGNPSPYYLTLSDIDARGPDGHSCGNPIEHLMLSPFSSHALDTPTCRPGGFHYQVISDAGNPRPYHVTLVPGRKSQGVPRS